jgi:hypothetical protein
MGTCISREWHSLRIGPLALAALAIAGPAAAASISDLNGRWSGWGSVTLANGSTEQVKCVATYFPEGSTGVQQNLRCASTNYKIDATAKLLVVNGRVSGEWLEKTHAAKGQVAGRTTSTGYDLSIQGETFSAALVLNTTSCKQSISIVPKGTDVTKISIGLGKC